MNADMGTNRRGAEAQSVQRCMFEGRVAIKFTQAEFARAFGIKRGTFVNYESGRTPWPLDLVAAAPLFIDQAITQRRQEEDDGRQQFLSALSALHLCGSVVKKR
jgi:transcriptional regulator with XRE-family HTH domain